MKTVMCFGTFDLLHLGHLHYFQQAKQHGDHLIVVIARDVTKQRQAKQIIFSEHERKQLVEQLDVVDEVVLGNVEDHFKIIQEKTPDIICLGYDHPIREEVLQQKLTTLGLFPDIKRMKSYQPEKHKSSLLKEKILHQD